MKKAKRKGTKQTKTKKWLRVVVEGFIAASNGLIKNGNTSQNPPV